MFQHFFSAICVLYSICKSSESCALSVMTHVSTTMSFPNLPSRVCIYVLTARMTLSFNNKA